MVLTCEQSPSRARREVLKDLLRALRLFGDGRVTLGALAWARAGGERLEPVALGAAGAPHGMLVVTPEQEDELRAFCNLVSRRAPHGNELAWALRRFELGCERASARGAERPSARTARAARAGGSVQRAARGAARGAVRDARAPRRADRAHDQGAGARARRDRRAAPPSAPQAWRSRASVADHLRALLRDVICGHLTPDLARSPTSCWRRRASADPRGRAGRWTPQAWTPHDSRARRGPAAGPRRGLTARAAVPDCAAPDVLSPGSDLGPEGAAQPSRYAAMRASPARSWTSSSRCGTSTGARLVQLVRQPRDRRARRAARARRSRRGSPPRARARRSPSSPLQQLRHLLDACGRAGPRCGRG